MDLKEIFFDFLYFGLKTEKKAKGSMISIDDLNYFKKLYNDIINHE